MYSIAVRDLIKCYNSNYTHYFDSGQYFFVFTFLIKSCAYYVVVYLDSIDTISHSFINEKCH